MYGLCKYSSNVFHCCSAPDDRVSGEISAEATKSVHCLLLFAAPMTAPTSGRRDNLHHELLVDNGLGPELLIGGSDQYSPFISSNDQASRTSSRHLMQ